MVENIWHEVALQRGAERASLDLGRPPQFTRLIHDEERAYVNARCTLDTTPADLPPAGALKRLKGKAKVRGAEFVVRVLGRYFEDEKDFLAHMVRLQNNVTVAHDRLAEEVIRLHTALSEQSRLLQQRDSQLHALLEARLEALERTILRTDQAG